MKSAIGAGALATSHGLDDLGLYSAGSEFFSVLQSRSIALQLFQLFRRAPFHSKFPKDATGGAAGAWRGEGLPVPATRTTADTITQERFEAAVLVAATAELFKFGRLTEIALRDIVVKGVARFLDQQLLDPANSGSANVKPAAITSAAASVTTAGATAANVITDLTALIAAITTPGDSLRWIMKATTYLWR